MDRLRWLDPRRTLGTRLTIIIVSLLLLTLAGATLVTLRVARASLTDQVGDNFQGQAESVSELVQLYLATNVNEVQQLASAHELVDVTAERNATYQGTSESILEDLASLDERWRSAPDDDALIISVTNRARAADTPGHALAEFLGLFEEHSEVFLTDRYGGTIAATGRLSDYYQADEEWWQAAWDDGAGAVYISNPEYDVSAGVMALLIAVPVVDDGGNAIGVLRSTLDVEELFGLLGATTLGDTGYAALLKGDGTQLFDPGVGTSRSLASLPPETREHLTSPEMNALVASGAIFGHEPLASSEPPFENATEAKAAAADAVARLGWHVIIRQDAGEALSTLNLIERVAWISGAVAVLIGAVAAVFIAQAVTRPLTRLTAAARLIGVGKLDVRLPASSNDEIGGLTSGFRAMSERLRAMIGTLEARTDQLSQANEALEGEVAERRRMGEALEQSLEAERERARRDSLTDTLNHGAITQVLRDICASEADGPVAVAMIDVDGLKTTNDTYGHQIGDQVLIATADALSRDGAIVGRYGGDEFVAVLPGADRAAAERYREQVNAELLGAELADPESGARIRVITSIGLAIYPEEASTVMDLIRLSDSAMYAWRRQRPLSPDAAATTPYLEDERAAKMVGQIVPLLTAPGDLNDRLRLAAHRLSVGAGYDAVDFVLFAEVIAAPIAQNTYARIDTEFLDAWTRESRADGPIPNPMRLLLEREKRPVVIDDIEHDNRVKDSQRRLLVAAGILSGLVVPLIWRDQVIGSLAAGSKRLAAFRAADAKFLTAVAAQATAVIRTEALVEELQSASTLLEFAHAETVMLLAAAAEAHDHTTGLHLQSVRRLSEALAREIGYSDEDACAIGLASALHDIGKVRVADAILTNPGKLAGDQWEIMKRHTSWGAAFLADRPEFELAASIALHHHENWDGSGYPDALSQNQIPEAARIVTVADAFDAITHERPYRAARPVEQAVREIVGYSGTQFDSNVVAALERLYDRNELPIAHPDASTADAA